MDKLYIPDRLNVGFQNRSYTYTGKLGYVIYYDHKGVLRKEKSWQGWRDSGIEPVEYPNEPIEGFVFNRNVGGVRRSYGWDARIEKVRVWDPRDFEFEITIPNLLYILSECNCSKGKGIEGKLVYAWSDSQLVLLPVSSADYKSSRGHTDLQSQKVKAKELIVGATYGTKKHEDLVYVGRFDYHAPFVVDPVKDKKPSVEKRYVFHTGTEYRYLDGMTSLAVLKSDEVAPNLSDLIDTYIKSEFGTKVKRLFTERRKWRELSYKERSELSFVSYPYYEDWAIPTHDGQFNVWRNTSYCGESAIECSHSYSVQDGILVVKPQKLLALGNNQTPNYSRYNYYRDSREDHTKVRWHQPSTDRLQVELESGSVFSVNACDLIPIFMKELVDGEDQ